MSYNVLLEFNNSNPLLPAPNVHLLLVNELRVQNFWLNTLPQIPGDVFYYFPHGATMSEAFYFGAALIVDNDIFTSIGTATTLTYLLGGVSDPAGIIQFLHCLHTFTGTIRTGAFFINDSLFLCDWTDNAIQLLEQTIFDDDVDEISINLQYSREYNHFWQSARRYLFLYNPACEISAEQLLQQQHELLTAFAQVIQDYNNE